MKEKELDKSLQKQESAGKDSVYGMLMAALERQPDVTTHQSIADGVLHKMALRKERSRRNYWLMMVLITTVFITVGFGALVIFMGWESFREIQDLSIYGILIGLMVVGIQYLDDKLLKRDLRFS